MGDTYLQFGCGLSAPAGWRNFDASPTLRLQRIPGLGSLFRRAPFPAFPSRVEYGDISRRLPVGSGTCRGIYASHVLEHLALGDFRRALSETRRLLATGGTFRLVVPDLEALARAYLASTSERPSSEFMEKTHLGRADRPRGPGAWLRRWLGNSAHLWMWDERSLSAELAEAGFVRVRRAVFGDAEDLRFREVEDPDRWAGCLGLECRR